MARTSRERKALDAIEKHGVLLVYPIDNRREPRSLWYELHPRTKMRWDWDESADQGVVDLWHLRAELAASRKVVYGKWYKGRAGFLSRSVFAAMLARLSGVPTERSLEAREILELLEDDSPRSTKELRRAAALTGRVGERIWTRSMKELWESLTIVGTGEVDDGSFPSLEVGATRWIFEDLWDAAREGSTDAQRALLSEMLATGSAFGKHWTAIVNRGDRVT